MKKLTCERLKYLIKDELNATKEYKSYGFNDLAKDESKHARFLKKKIKEICK